MNVFKNSIKEIFQDIVDKYKLSIVFMDDSQFFLVGNLFALSIGISVGDIEVFYIKLKPKVKKEALSVYYITNLLQDRFNVEDRNKYGSPKTNEEYKKAQLRVLTSGLFYRWDDLLDGDKRWLKKYQLEELPANQPTVNILLPIFQSQLKKKS